MKLAWREHHAPSPIDGKTMVYVGLTAAASIGRYSINPVHTDANGARTLSGYMVYFVDSRISPVRESDRWLRLRRGQTGSGLLSLKDAKSLCDEHLEANGGEAVR